MDKPIKIMFPQDGAQVAPMEGSDYWCILGIADIQAEIEIVSAYLVDVASSAIYEGEEQYVDSDTARMFVFRIPPQPATWRLHVLKVRKRDKRVRAQIPGDTVQFVVKKGRAKARVKAKAGNGYGEPSIIRPLPPPTSHCPTFGAYGLIGEGATAATPTLNPSPGASATWSPGSDLPAGYWGGTWSGVNAPAQYTLKVTQTDGGILSYSQLVNIVTC
jgi:hypothetical protein